MKRGGGIWNYGVAGQTATRVVTVRFFECRD